MTRRAVFAILKLHFTKEGENKMLKDAYGWLDGLIGKLQAELGERVLFVGLQGSYRRGEATEESDIDVVTILDKVDLPTLDAYRRLVRSMPQGELACGFLCGREELLRWPRFDLLQMVLDTQPRLGSWEDLLPGFMAEDTAEAVRVGASGLYHAGVHCWLYEQDRAAALRGLAKSVFFLLRMEAYQKTGRYCINKKELEGCISEEERPLLALSRDPAGATADLAQVERLYAQLLPWSAGLMA